MPVFISSILDERICPLIHWVYCFKAIENRAGRHGKSQTEYMKIGKESFDRVPSCCISGVCSNQEL